MAPRLPGMPTAFVSATVEFYDADPGTNYAQARYLCYYLQEHGLLVRFYHGFVRHHAEAPSGLATPKRVLGAEDMDAFKAKWEAFVMGLTFP